MHSALVTYRLIIMPNLLFDHPSFNRITGSQVIK